MARIFKTIVILLMIPLSLFLIFTLQAGFIFIIFGLMPSLVMYFVDGFQGKPTFKCVFFCNLSGMIPTFSDAMSADSAAIAMQTLMGEAFNWFLVFGAAGAGYALLLFSRVLTQITLSITDQARIEAFKKSQKDLVEEWGSMVKLQMI